MSANEIAFSVTGEAVPQGSMRAFKHPSTGAVIMTHSNKPKLDQWRDAIRHEAQALGQPCTNGPVELHATFILARPKRLAKKPAPRHVTRPDCDKLIRAVADALTGVLWADDSQIDLMIVGKRYTMSGEATGVQLSVTQVGE